MESQLSAHNPSILERLLAPVGQCLIPEVHDFLLTCVRMQTRKPASKHSQIHARKDSFWQKNGLSMKRPLPLLNSLACCKRKRGAYLILRRHD